MCLGGLDPWSTDTRGDARFAATAACLGFGVLAFLPGDTAHAAVTVPGALLAVMLIARTRGAADIGVLGSGILVYFGRRSYSLYLWHWPIVRLILPEMPMSRLVGIVVALGASVLVAELSWRYVEAPWLRPRQHRAPSGEVAATSSSARR